MAIQYVSYIGADKTQIKSKLDKVTQDTIIQANEAGAKLDALSKTVALHVMAGKFDALPQVTESEAVAKKTGALLVNHAVGVLFSKARVIVRDVETHGINVVDAWANWQNHAKRTRDLSVEGLRKAVTALMPKAKGKPDAEKNSGKAGDVDQGEVSKESGNLSQRLANMAAEVRKSDFYSEKLMQLIKAAMVQASADEQDGGEAEPAPVAKPASRRKAKAATK